MLFVPKETKGNRAKIKNNLATLLVKNKSHDKFEIRDYDLKKYKIYYFKNISGDTKTPIINS